MALKLLLSVTALSKFAVCDGFKAFAVCDDHEAFDVCDDLFPCVIVMRFLLCVMTLSLLVCVVDMNYACMFFTEPSGVNGFLDVLTVLPRQ